MRNRTFPESTASEKAEESSRETAIPVGADMVVIEQAGEDLYLLHAQSMPSMGG